MITDEQFQKLRETLQRSNSAMFVLGSGYKPSGLPTYKEASWLMGLHSSNSEDVESAWRKGLELNTDAKLHPFLMTYPRWVKETSPINIQKFYIMKTGVGNDVIDHDMNFSSLLELNGNITTGIDKMSGREVLVSSDSDLNNVHPVFPTVESNYSDSARFVRELELSVANDISMNNIFFLGCSGECHVTESLFNQSLVRTLKNHTSIVVANTDKDCFMSDVATLSFTCDAVDFLDSLHERFMQLPSVSGDVSYSDIFNKIY